MVEAQEVARSRIACAQFMTWYQEMLADVKVKASSAHSLTTEFLYLYCSSINNFHLRCQKDADLWDKFRSEHAELLQAIVNAWV